MDGRPQIREGDSVHLGQRKLDCRADRQRFQILKNALYEVVVLSAPIPSNICQDNSFVVQSGFWILYIVVGHTFCIPREIGKENLYDSRGHLSTIF